MPVRRLRSFEEARRELWVEGNAPSLSGRIRSLWAFSARLAPPCPRRGVLRFRTIGEANAERETREQARVQALLASRASSLHSATPSGSA